jgi:hypothetical protein
VRKVVCKTCKTWLIVNVGWRPALRIFRSISTPFIARKESTVFLKSIITAGSSFRYEELSDITLSSLHGVLGTVSSIDLFMTTTDERRIK